MKTIPLTNQQKSAKRVAVMNAAAKKMIGVKVGKKTTTWRVLETLVKNAYLAGKSIKLVIE